MTLNPLKTRLLNTKKKRYVTLAVLVVIAVLILFLAWMSSANEGTVSNPSSQRPAAPVYKDFDGRFITFRYPGMYTYRSLEPKTRDLELYNFAASTMYQKDIAVSVSELPAGNLNNNSAYNLRRSQPETYGKRDISIAGAPATLWVKHDGKEQTAIIPQGGRVAVLSFTTAGPTEGLSGEVTALLQTFRWK